jgi:hypothetical protein
MANSKPSRNAKALRNAPVYRAFSPKNHPLDSTKTLSFDQLHATSTGPLHGELILMKNGSKKRAWTPVQVRELKSLARKKTPARKIAKSLKRTEGATRQKAFSLGLSLDSRA